MRKIRQRPPRRQRTPCREVRAPTPLSRARRHTRPGYQQVRALLTGACVDVINCTSTSPVPRFRSFGDSFGDSALIAAIWHAGNSRRSGTRRAVGRDYRTRQTCDTGTVREIR